MKEIFKITEKIMQYILGLAVVVGFFMLLFQLTKVAIPENNNDMLNIVIGALIGAFITVVGFYYGSSKGSSDKNDMISK